MSRGRAVAIFFTVRPRYAGGSPAQVDEATARRVASDEREGFERTVEGAYGVEPQQLAAQAGLAGIVEEITERADCWVVRDLLTDATFVRPFTVTGEREATRAKRLARLRRKHWPLGLEGDAPLEGGA